MAQAAIIHKCVLCDAEKNVDYYCINCEEILCSNCKQTHSKNKKTRNDKIISLEQARRDNVVRKSTVAFCRKHSTVEITLFCLKCDKLICTECFANKHQGHNITTPDEIKDIKAAELKKNILALQEKKYLYESVFENEHSIHSRFSKSVDQVKIDISNRKAKIIEELNSVCDGLFAQISQLQQNEDERYSRSCNEMQVQRQSVSSTEQYGQECYDSNNAVRIIQATMDTSHAINELEDPTMSQAGTATYQTSGRSQPTIHHLMGKVHVELGTKPKYKLLASVLKRKFHVKKTNDDKQEIKHDPNKPCIDPAKVRIRYSTTVMDKELPFISTIVPLQDKTAWVAAAEGDKHLILIDDTGDVISSSVTLDNHIYDAKEYSDGLVFTCEDCCRVFKMTSERILNFRDLSPYYARGLCVTQENDVVVCLTSSIYINDNKVIRLGRNGEIKQTIESDGTGAPLYRSPLYVTVLTTGEIIVTDWSKPSRIVGTDSEGQHLFTWEGELQEEKLDAYSVYSITHDSKNNLFVTDKENDRVFVLGKGGSGAMCLLDTTHGIGGPSGIAIDSLGQLWIGGNSGDIHIIEY